MATSSPVWTVLLAVSGVWRHRACLSMLPIIEALLVAWCATLAFRIALVVLRGSWPDRGLARHVFPTLAGGGTILLLMSSAYAQMESPLAIGLLLAAAYSFLRGSRWGLVWLSFAALTRLEMLPLLALALVFAAGVRKVVDASIAAATVVAVFAGFLFWQFGVVLPNSMHAKSIGYGLSHSDAFGQFFPPRLTGHFFLCGLLGFFLCVLIDCSFGTRPAGEKDFRWLPAISFSWGMIVILEYTVESAMMFDWYLPLIYVPLLLGLLLYRPAGNASLWLRGTLLSTAILGLTTIMIHPVKSFARLLVPIVRGTPEAVGQFDGFAGFRVHQYFEVGATLHATCPSGRVMSPEIGALGFGFEGHVDDAFGIASPLALAFQPLRSGAASGGVPAGYVHALHPDVIVSYDFLATEVTNDAELMKEYRLTGITSAMHSSTTGRQIEAGWMGSRHLNVFVLRGGRCDTGAVASGLGNLRF
ncbi:hypothetical protein GRAN_4202 [Granulicella sibirica]|uniref:Uncharacterized protein n=2 Tax=Granulicella sibirica TaxID=2479048 RepID=A0A4Q0SZM7_9BACT|nr:hypothetical protein GRAN_4202 [Granulicella sibirica]